MTLLDEAVEIPGDVALSRVRVSSNPGRPVSPFARVSRTRAIVLVSLTLFGGICLAMRLLYPFDFLGHHPPGSLLHWLFPRLKRLTADWSLAAMIVYPPAMLGIFILERLFPAVPSQKTLSNGLAHDALWQLIDAALDIIIVRWYGAFLVALYTQYFSFLTVTPARTLPVAARLVIGILAMDFLRWWQHWLHHKVKWLWPFHAVHHSQKELTALTGARNHFVNYFLRYALTALPMLVLDLNLPQIIFWELLLQWHTRFYHANIRGNFGLLRYVFVNPQSHRIHHSFAPEHVDKNYGACFVFWDYLFGTQYRRYDVYPETGINDDQFPAESADSISAILLAPLRQTLYPFLQVLGIPFRSCSNQQHDMLTHK